jgi:hypothetical protein
MMGNSTTNTPRLVVTILSIAIAACAASPQPDAEQFQTVQSGLHPDDGVQLLICPANVALTPLRDDDPHRPEMLWHPAVEHVYWGSYWKDGDGGKMREAQDAAWSTILSKRQFWDPIWEYAALGEPVSPPYVNCTPEACETTPWRGSWFDTNDLPGGDAAAKGISKAAIEAELAYGIDHGQLRLPYNAYDQVDTLYVVYMPTGWASYMKPGSEGHHKYFIHNNHFVPYAVVEWQGDADLRNVVESHEIYEAVTDPYSRGYRDQQTNKEVGDLCQDDRVDFFGYKIEGAWSQSACRCVSAQDLWPPSKVRSRPVECNAVALDWQPGEGIAPDDFRILQYCAAGEGCVRKWLAAGLGPDARSYKIDHLLFGQSYTFDVCAMHGKEPEQCASISMTVECPIIPGDPQNTGPFNPTCGAPPLDPCDDISIDPSGSL